MLDLRFIVGNKETVEASLVKRGKENLFPIINDLVSLDLKRRELLQEVEGLKYKKNQASEEIAKKKKAKEDAETLITQMREIGEQIKGLDGNLGGIEEKIKVLLYEIPNLLDESVPSGFSSEQNVEIRRWGQQRAFDFPVKSHDEIGEALGILDFKKASLVAGARFVFLKGLAVKLERALIQFMMDTHSRVGYEEMLPPFLVNADSLMGTGQLPKFEEDVFRVEKHGYYLIPTAEVPITNYHRNDILEENKLPIKYVAFSPCFRSEAGSYGKDTKGLKRQHQFDKIELVKFTTPEHSMDELESLLKDAENILQHLKLPYRVMSLCGADIGFSSFKTYDLEVWAPSTKHYMEISSCSNFGDFQARRANIRYRDMDGKVHFVHTLNGSGLAVGRTLLAILENYQQKDGTIAIPEVLKKYI